MLNHSGLHLLEQTEVLFGYAGGVYRRIDARTRRVDRFKQLRIEVAAGGIRFREKREQRGRAVCGKRAHGVGRHAVGARGSRNAHDLLAPGELPSRPIAYAKSFCQLVEFADAPGLLGQDLFERGAEESVGLLFLKHLLVGRKAGLERETREQLTADTVDRAY